MELSKEHKAGLIIALIILFLVNLTTIYGYLIKPERATPFEIPLCSVSNKVGIDVAQQEKEKFLNVPDYSAKVFINLTRSNYVVDDIAGINVKIKDEGITKLSKPYFYTLVFDPSDKLKMLFPCFINEEEKQFTGGGDTTRNKFKSKWDKWVSPTKVLGNQYLSCTDKEAFYFSPNDCIPRSSLITGYKDKNPISYTFKITEPGTWKIYVFLFDEEYVSRPNIRLYRGEYRKPYETFENAVAYGYSEFLVRSEVIPVAPSWMKLSNIVSQFVKILLAGIGYYFVSRDTVYPKLEDIYEKHIDKCKCELIGLLVFLIIITVYLLIIFNILL